MASEADTPDATGPDPRNRARFVASRWERAVADQFLSWRTTSGTGMDLMRTFADAIHRMLQQHSQLFAHSADLALKLRGALESCDQLAFDDGMEALAYAGLHLLDRYGRVSQVLEHLFRIGRLPLRLGGAQVLEVGAGPAPALYAIRDFYAALLRWPGRGAVEFAPLRACHTLDRGRAWDILLHRLSETLMTVRGQDVLKDGALAFGRSAENLSGFDVRERHHASVARNAWRISGEFDHADEPIADATARRLAYEEGVAEPSAYDLIFLCNFLTQPSMTEQFEPELRRLAGSLTPGGLLIVVGATGGTYPGVYAKVREIAASAKLQDVSPKDAFRGNEGDGRLSMVASHIRGNVDFAIAQRPLDDQRNIREMLPTELVDERVPFKLPKFQALIFVNQQPHHQKARKRGRPGK